MLQNFTSPTRTAAHMPTSAALPATITPQTHARRHTRCDKPYPPQRHVSVMARVTQNSAHLQPTHAASPTHTQRTNIHVLHASTASHTAATIAPREITTARTPQTTRYTAPPTPHAAHGKSHPVTHAASAPHSLQSCLAAQRRRDAAGELVAVQVQPPAGHTSSHRVTPCHPALSPTPASRPQRIAAQRIPSIKSSQMGASQHTACYRSRATTRASDPDNDITRKPTGT
jgi:hypothetical protein